MKKSTSQSKSTKASKYYDIKPFSYFIPAPPQRKEGYREKEFDSVLYEFLRMGHELISISSAPIDGKGILVTCILGSTHKKAMGLHLEIDAVVSKNNSATDPSLEIIYE